MYRLFGWLERVLQKLFEALAWTVEALEQSFNRLWSRIVPGSPAIPVDRDDSANTTRSALSDAPEAFLAWGLSRLGRLFMPWRWFRQENEEFDREAGTQRSTIDSFESEFDHTLSIFAALLPWRWMRVRRDNPAESDLADAHIDSFEAKLEAILLSGLRLFSPRYWRAKIRGQDVDASASEPETGLWAMLLRASTSSLRGPLIATTSLRNGGILATA